MELRIEYILNCAKEWKNYHPEIFTYHNANFMDVEDQSIVEHFDKCFEFIERAKTQNKRILVHCIIGKSRSASVVIGYLMKSQKMTLKESYEYVKNKRNMIQPNEGFMKQLLMYEVDLYQTNSMQHGDWTPISVNRSKVKKPELSKKEASKAVTNFLDHFVTEDLLKRGIDEACNGSLEKRKLGIYMAWVSQTINQKEDLKEQLNDLGIAWKDVTKKIGERAKEYFLSQPF